MTTPSREEIDAIWAELRDLRKRTESDVLMLAKAFFGLQLIGEYYAQLPSLKLEHAKAFERYFADKLNSARKRVFDSQSVEEMREIVLAFYNDLLSYLESLE